MEFFACYSMLQLRAGVVGVFSLVCKQEPLEAVVTIVSLLLFAVLFYTGNIWYILPRIKMSL